MSARLLLSRTTRTTIRTHALGAGIGLSVYGATAGGLLNSLTSHNTQFSSSPTTRFLFDAPAAAIPASSRAYSSGNKNGGLDPDLLAQMSKGSITGFLAGLVLSVFSKTLVLLTGVAVVLTQVAARYGIDIVKQLQVKERIHNSRVLAALEKDPAFKLSFGFFFAMSAFIGF